MKVLNSHTGAGYQIINGDTCEIIRDIPDESIHFEVFSPPFSSLYTYSNSDRDLGNSKDDKQFFEHFRFISTELYRILKPGRIMAVHCMNIPASKERDGYIGLKDFRGQLIREFEEVGFIYHGEVTIWKDPVTQMQRTKALGLLHKQIKKDSCRSRMGLPDYIIIMRKDGENPEPVTHTMETYPVSEWQEVASPIWDYEFSPVWWDINPSDTLNVQAARDGRDERHICFKEGTLVLSKRGYVPIESLEVGSDEVLTNSGEWHTVTAKALTKKDADVIQVKANGVPHLVCTPEHKIMAKPFKKWGKHVRKEAVKSQQAVWTEAKDCKEHYLKSVLPPVMESNISPEEWWIIGRWVADGHIDVRGKQFFISVGNKKWDEFVKHAEKWIGHVNDKKECNCKQVGLSGLSDDARAILKKVGKHAEEKVLPYEIISLNKELSKAFLDGYESGDGCICHGKRLYSSTSRGLLLGVAIVAQRVYGKVASVYAGRGERISYIRGREIHCNQEWNMVLSPHFSYSFEDENGTWKKVKDVISGGKANVWSIEVETDHSYMAEGVVVKNCPLQLPVIDRLIKLYTNEGDIVFTPFMGIGSEVYEAVLNNRRGLGIELKESYYKCAVENLQRAEFEMAQPTLFDFMGEL